MRTTPRLVYGAILIAVLVTVIAICGCTSSGPSPQPTATQTQAPGTATVAIQNFAFIPASITVPRGTTVTWMNQDPADHQIASDAQGGNAEGALFMSDSLPKSAIYSHTFDTPGTYTYHCSIHPSMKATIIVT